MTEPTADPLIDRLNRAFNNYSIAPDWDGLSKLELLSLLREAAAALAQRNTPPENHRWNFERIDGGIRICEGHHERAHGCEWEYFVPKDAQRDGIPREPVAWYVALDIANGFFHAQARRPDSNYDWRPLYAAPTGIPRDDARDAARYRCLRDRWWLDDLAKPTSELMMRAESADEFDAAVDAMQGANVTCDPSSSAG